MAALAALLTPLYTFRMFFLVFLERPAGRRPEDIKPVPAFMAWVIWPLALLALFDGLLNLPFGPGKRWLGHFLSVLPGSRIDLGAPPGYELIMGAGSAILILLTIALTYYLYRPAGPRFDLPRGSRWLLEGFYLDNLYRWVFVGPYIKISHFLWQVDEGSLDKNLDKGAGGVVSFSQVFGYWTTGRLSTYVKMLFLGLTILFSGIALHWYFW